MAARAHWTPDAESDLEEIFYWIAVEDERPEVAMQIAQQLHDKANEFA